MKNDESGVALITVLGAVVVITLLGVLVSTVAVNRAEQVASRDGVNDVFGAAEAELDRYRSKLIDNPYYHLQFVDPLERTRECTDATSTSFGVQFAPGDIDPSATQTAWPGDCASWTYVEDPANAWVTEDGIGRRLEVEAVSGATVRVVSAAVNEVGQTRTVDATYERRTIGEFMLLARSFLRTNTNNTTYTGKFYGAQDCSLSGDNTVAYDDYLCEGDLDFPRGGPFTHPRAGEIAFVSPAWCYDGDGAGTIGSNDCANIREALEQPIDFNGFWDDLEGLRFAACESGGLCFEAGEALDRVGGGTVTMPDLGDDGWIRLIFKGPGDGSAATPRIEVWTTTFRNHRVSPTYQDRYRSNRGWQHTLGTWRDPQHPVAGDNVNDSWTLLADDLAYPSNGAIYTPHHLVVGWCDKASRKGACQRNAGGSLEVPFGLYAGNSTASGSRHIVFADSFVRPAGSTATAVFMASAGTSVPVAGYPATGGEFRLDAAVVTQGAHNGDLDVMRLAANCYDSNDGVDWRFIGLHSGSADITVYGGTLSCLSRGYALEQGYDTLLRTNPPPWIPTLDGDGWSLTRWVEISAPDWVGTYAP